MLPNGNSRVHIKEERLTANPTTVSALKILDAQKFERKVTIWKNKPRIGVRYVMVQY